MTENTTASKAEVKPEVKFQHYLSSRPSVQLITTKGKRIVFISGQFITSDPAIIEYLNSEIKQGLNIITKGKLMTKEEADPMAALKKKHIEEYLTQKAETAKDKALGKEKDFGSTKETTGSKLGAASTKAIAAASAGSAS